MLFGALLGRGLGREALDVRQLVASGIDSSCVGLEKQELPPRLFNLLWPLGSDEWGRT
jgi:hypothetical protein